MAIALEALVSTEGTVATAECGVDEPHIDTIPVVEDVELNDTDSGATDKLYASDDEVEEDEPGEYDDVPRAPVDDDVGEFSTLETDADALNRILREIRTVPQAGPKDYKLYDEETSPPFPVKSEFHVPHGYVMNLGMFKNKTGVEMMHELWDDEMNLIRKHSNIGIQQTSSKIKPITRGDIKRFYGMRMIQSMFKRPTMRNCFQDDIVLPPPYQMPNLSPIMSDTRFSEINKSIRLEDYGSVTEDEKKKDKAWKVRSLFTMVKTKCKKFMPSPSEFISVDEAMIKYYGKRCPISKSMPAKPIKRGFLLYCAVDYKTKWVFDLNLSDGGYKSEDFTDVPWGMTGQRVLDLVKNIPGKAHTIVFDNYYTSEALAIELLDVYGHYCLGTFRKNRIPKSIPDTFVSKSKNPKPTKKTPKGDIKACVNTANNIASYAFMDSGLVYIIDTAYGPAMKDIVKRRCGDSQVPLTVYKGIHDYNAEMGGVDAADATRTGYYCVESVGRASRWTVRFAESMFNFMLSQAWVAYKFHNPQVSRYGRLEFYAGICRAYLLNDDDDQRHLLTRNEAKHAEWLEYGKHHNIIRTQKDTGHVKKDGSVRLKVASCCYCENIEVEKRLVPSKYSIKTNLICEQCNVPLHAECFGHYHNDLIPKCHFSKSS